jgi:hypothetical protein
MSIRKLISAREARSRESRLALGNSRLCVAPWRSQGRSVYLQCTERESSAEVPPRSSRRRERRSGMQRANVRPTPRRRGWSGVAAGCFVCSVLTR